jgi:hypothetical protein
VGDFKKIRPWEILRDGLLCPEHSAQLESLLEPLPHRLSSADPTAHRVVFGT